MKYVIICSLYEDESKHKTKPVMIQCEKIGYMANRTKTLRLRMECAKWLLN